MFLVLFQLTAATSTDVISQQSQRPPGWMPCRLDEYLSDSICCKLCPAGESPMVHDARLAPSDSGRRVKCFGYRVLSTRQGSGA